MKWGVLADIHGNSFALNKVIEDMVEENIDEYIFLGDLVMVGPDPNAVFDKVNALDPICWIKGNTDMWFEEMSEGWKPKTDKENELFDYYTYAADRLSEKQINHLLNLSTEESIKYNGWEILCVHGAPGDVTGVMDNRVSQANLSSMVKKVKEDIILCGHSHVPYIGKINGKYIINAGSIGRSLDGDNRASYGIIDFTLRNNPKFKIKRVNYSIDETIKLAEKNKFPNIEKYAQGIKSAKFI